MPSHRGKHSSLYLGSDLVSSTVVALKKAHVIAPLEVCLLRQVRATPHANIIKLLDDFTQPGELWMVFPLADSDVWAKWSFLQGRMERQAALGYLMQACSGVAHLHALGIIHRNLAMQSMLLSGDAGRHLRLCDFSCAISTGEVDLLCNREAAHRYWMAPEATLYEHSPTAGLDTWSLGVLAMALSTGILLFESCWIGTRSKRLSKCWDPFQQPIGPLTAATLPGMNCVKRQRAAHPKEAYLLG